MDILLIFLFVSKRNLHKANFHKNLNKTATANSTKAVHVERGRSAQLNWIVLDGDKWQGVRFHRVHRVPSGRLRTNARVCGSRCHQRFPREAAHHRCQRHARQVSHWWIGSSTLQLLILYSKLFLIYYSFIYLYLNRKIECTHERNSWNWKFVIILKLTSIKNTGIWKSAPSTTNKGERICSILMRWSQHLNRLTQMIQRKK